MSILNEQFFNELKAKDTWSAGVSFKRSNPVPIERYSVFENKEEALAYAESNVVAYPGQVIAVAEENGSMSVYVLNQDVENQKLVLKQVGFVPSGDEKTIEVNAEGAISLLGATNAANGTIPMIDSETGKMVWKTLEDIGAGDGNDNTTYEFAFADEKITITPKFNGIAQDTIELDLSSFVTADELQEAINAIEIPEDTNTEYHLEYDSEKKEIKLVTGANSEKMVIDATPFIKDGMLHDVDYDTTTQELIFQWNTDAGVAEDRVPVSGLVDVYTAGNGLELTSNEFAVKVDSESEAFLSVNANGIKVSGVQEAINSAANTAKEEAIADAAQKYYTKSEVYTIGQTDQAIADKISEVNGGQSAGEVLGQLNAYKKTVNMEVWGNETGSGDSRIDTLDSKVNSLENSAIKTIKRNGIPLTVDSEKAVDIEVPTSIVGMGGYSDLASRVATNEGNITSLQGKVNTNSGKITTLEGQATNFQNSIDNHLDRIIALEGHDTQYQSLVGRVNENSIAISKINTDVIPTLAKQSDLESATQRITTAEGKITTLNEVTIPALSKDYNDKLALKANSSDVYTKNEIGTIPEGKTLVTLISEAQAAATYDDTAVKQLIDDEEKRAIAREDELAAQITNLANVVDFKGVLEEIPTDNSGYKNGDVIIVETEEYVFDGDKWVNYGSASAAGAQITALSKDIAAINTKIGEVPKGQSLMAMINAIPVADGTSIVEKDGKLSVNEVSTDLLVPGTETLYLYGGSSAAE